MTVVDAARSGDEVVALEAVRDKLAEQLDVATPGVAAGIANQLQAVLRRLAELKPSGKVTLYDALAERGAGRVGGAVVVPPAARKAKRAS